MFRMVFGDNICEFLGGVVEDFFMWGIVGLYGSGILFRNVVIICVQVSFIRGEKVGFFCVILWLFRTVRFVFQFLEVMFFFFLGQIDQEVKGGYEVVCRVGLTIFCGNIGFFRRGFWRVLRVFLIYSECCQFILRMEVAVIWYCGFQFCLI